MTDKRKNDEQPGFWELFWARRRKEALGATIDEWIAFLVAVSILVLMIGLIVISAVGVLTPGPSDFQRQHTAVQECLESGLYERAECLVWEQDNGGER